MCLFLFSGITITCNATESNNADARYKDLTEFKEHEVDSIILSFH